MGRFEAGDFAVSEDNALYYSDGASHPIQLRISLQVGDLLFANNRDVGPMTYRIVIETMTWPGRCPVG